MRGEEMVSLKIEIATMDQHPDPEIDAAEPQKNMIRQLGVVAGTVTPDSAKSGDLRIASGVVVVAPHHGPHRGSISAG